MRERIGGLVEEARHEASIVVARRLREHPLFCKARVVYAFAPRCDEPDWTIGGLDVEKTWAFPRVENGEMSFWRVSSMEDFSLGTFNIREPLSREVAPPPDLILVPALAFTATGQRLGRGGGFYDRFLAEMPAPSLGIAFACQVLGSLPTEEHDTSVTDVVTR